MTAAAKSKPPKQKRVPRYVYARVQHDGALVCEDDASRATMRCMRVRRGQLVRLAVSKERDYGQWKKAHKLGTLLAHSLDEFSEFLFEDGKVDSHGSLKKLQRLSGVLCEESQIEVPGLGTLTVKVPQSMSFDELDECAFQAAYAGFCQYLIAKHWKDLTPEDVEHMASLVGLSG